MEDGHSCLSPTMRRARVPVLRLQFLRQLFAGSSAVVSFRLVNSFMPRHRIVSLIASATEIVAALGLEDSLVGISHECDYPRDVLDLPRLSAPKVDPRLSSAEIDRGVREIVRDGLSVYQVKVSELEQLRPDVIVTQDHCEVCAVSLSDVEEALQAKTLTYDKAGDEHYGVVSAFIKSMLGRRSKKVSDDAA